MIKFIAKVFSVKMVSGLGVLLLNFFISYAYGVDKLGSFMYVLSIVVGLSVVSRAGLDNYLMKAISVLLSDERYDCAKRLMVKAVLHVLMVSIILLVCGLGYFYGYAGSGLDNVSLYVFLSLPLYALVYIQSAIMKSIGKQAVAPLFETGAVALLTTCSIAVLWWIDKEDSHDYIGFVFMISSILMVLFGSIIVIKETSGWKRTEGQESVKIKYGDLAHFFSLSFVSYVMQWGVILIVAIVVSEEGAGAFSLLHRMTLLVGFILIVTNGAFGAKFASKYHEKDIVGLQHIISRLLMINGLFALFVAVALGVFLLIFGEKVGLPAEQYMLLLGILAFGKLVHVVTGPSSYLLMMTGYAKELSKAMLVYSVFLVMAIWFGGVYWGLAGVIVLMVVVSIIRNLLFVPLVKKKVGVDLLKLGYT